MGLGRMFFGGRPKGKWVRADKPPANPIPGFIGTLVVGAVFVLVAQCAGGRDHPTEPPNMDKAPQTAAQPTKGACPEDFLPVTATEGPPSQWTQKRTISLPNLEGMNGEKAVAFLQGQGIKDIEKSSDNPKYKSVWEPKNWTVVRTWPEAGCVLNSFDKVTLYLTKP